MTNSARLGETARSARLARSWRDSDRGIQIGKLAENQKIRLIEGGLSILQPREEA